MKEVKRQRNKERERDKDRKTEELKFKKKRETREQFEKGARHWKRAFLMNQVKFRK